jgi:hypothetical protein
MSNLGDLAADLGDKNAKAIAIGGDVLGLVADIGGAAGAISSLLGLFLPQDHQLADALDALNADFHQIAGIIDAEDKLQRMRDIDSGITPAVGVLQQLPAMVQALPSLSTDFILQQIQTCVDAAIFFDLDDKWQAVAGAVPQYSDQWTGTIISPSSADGLVFNYTYTLPQCLRAVYILLTVIKALSPASLSDYDATLAASAARLQSVHDTIVSTGIIGSRVPTPDQVGYVSGYPDSEGGPPLAWESAWYGDGIEVIWAYGAIEQYSAANNVGSYMAYVDYGIDMEAYSQLDSYAANFVTVLEFRIAIKKKQLYEQLGLTAVRQAISQLRSITGQPSVTGARYEECTVSEGFSLLGLALGPPGPGRLRALESLLAATPPYCGWWAFTDGTGPGPDQTTWMDARPAPGPSRIVGNLLGRQMGPGWPNVGLPAVSSLLLK